MMKHKSKYIVILKNSLRKVTIKWFVAASLVLTFAVLFVSLQATSVQENDSISKVHATRHSATSNNKQAQKSSTTGSPAANTKESGPLTANTFIQSKNTQVSSVGTMANLVISQSAVTVQAGSGSSLINMHTSDGVKTLPPMISGGNNASQILLNYNATGLQSNWQVTVIPTSSTTPGTYTVTISAQGGGKTYTGTLTVVVTERPHIVASLQQDTYYPQNSYQSFILSIQRIAGYAQPVTNVIVVAPGGLSCNRGEGTDPSQSYGPTAYFTCQSSNGAPLTNGIITMRVSTPLDSTTASAQFQFPSQN